MSNQPRFETVVFELIMVKNEVFNALSNLKKWMQPQSVEKNLVRLLFVFPPLPELLHPNTITGIIQGLHNLVVAVWVLQRKVLCCIQQSRLNLGCIDLLRIQWAVFSAVSQPVSCQLSLECFASLVT